MYIYMSYIYSVAATVERNNLYVGVGCTVDTTCD